VHFHFCEIVGDSKQSRRLERGGNRLADIHVARDHNTVDGRTDDGVVQVDSDLIDRCLSLRHLCLVDLELRYGGIVRGLRGVQITLRGQFAFAQLACSRQSAVRVLNADLGLGKIRLRRYEIRLRLIHRRSEFIRIELGDHLPGFNFRIEIGEELVDGSRYLAAHLHCDSRLQRAGRRDNLRDISSLHGCGHKRDFVRASSHAPIGKPGAAGE